MAELLSCSPFKMQDGVLMVAERGGGALLIILTGLSTFQWNSDHGGVLKNIPCSSASSDFTLKH